MISTDEEYEKESIIFFNKQCEYLNEKFPFNIESMAYEYVRRSPDFKYRDHVEAGVLVQCLERFGYIEFTNREKDRRYHSLTSKGMQYVKKINQGPKK